MLKYYFSDIEDLRYCIEILNDKIEAYGCIGVDFVKQLMGVGDTNTRFVDSRFGWTEVFLESRDVKAQLRGKHWEFEFTLPEQKELY